MIECVEGPLAVEFPHRADRIRWTVRLRAAVPELGFVYLALTPDEAAERVTHRPGHFMPATLIDSQFRDLEPPVSEPRVLTVSATDPLSSIVDTVIAWRQCQS